MEPSWLAERCETDAGTRAAAPVALGGGAAFTAWRTSRLRAAAAAQRKQQQRGGRPDERGWAGVADGALAGIIADTGAALTGAFVTHSPPKGKADEVRRALGTGRDPKVPAAPVAAAAAAAAGAAAATRGGLSKRLVRTDHGFAMLRRPRRPLRGLGQATATVKGKNDRSGPVTCDKSNKSNNEGDNEISAASAEAFTNASCTALALVPYCSSGVAGRVAVPAGGGKPGKTGPGLRVVGGSRFVDLDGSSFAQGLDLAQLQSAARKGLAEMSAASTSSALVVVGRPGSSASHGADESSGLAEADIAARQVKAALQCLDQLRARLSTPLALAVAEMLSALGPVLFADGDGDGGARVLYRARTIELERERAGVAGDERLWGERLHDMQVKVQSMRAIFNKASAEERSWEHQMAVLRRNAAELVAERANLENRQARLSDRTLAILRDMDATEIRVQATEADAGRERAGADALSAELDGVVAELNRLRQAQKEEEGRMSCGTDARVSQLVYHQTLAELERAQARLDELRVAEQAMAAATDYKRSKLMAAHKELARAERDLAAVTERPPVHSRPEYRAHTPRPDWQHVLRDKLPVLDRQLQSHLLYNARTTGKEALPSPRSPARGDRERARRRSSLRRDREAGVSEESFTAFAVAKMVELLMDARASRSAAQQPPQLPPSPEQQQPQQQQRLCGVGLGALRAQVESRRSQAEQTRAALATAEQLIPASSPYFEEKAARAAAALASDSVGASADAQDDGGEGGGKNLSQAERLRRATLRPRRGGALQLRGGDEGRPVTEEETYALMSVLAKEAAARRAAKPPRKEAIQFMVARHREMARRMAASGSSADGGASEQGGDADDAGWRRAAGSGGAGAGVQTADRAPIGIGSAAATTDKVITCLGTSLNVPKFLRMNGKVRSREMTDDDLAALIEGLLRGRHETRQTSPELAALAFNDFVFEFFKNRFGIQSLIVEWGYNFVNELQKRSDVWATARAVLLVIAGDDAESITGVLHQHHLALLALFERVDAERQRCRAPGSGAASSGAGSAALSGKVHFDDVMRTLKAFFPDHDEEEIERLGRRLRIDTKNAETVAYGKLFAAPRRSAFIQGCLLAALNRIVRYADEYSKAIARLGEDAALARAVAAASAGLEAARARTSAAGAGNATAGASAAASAAQSRDPATLAAVLVLTEAQAQASQAAAQSVAKLSQVRAALLAVDPAVDQERVDAAIAAASAQDLAELDWDVCVNPAMFARILRVGALLMPSAQLCDPDCTIELADIATTAPAAKRAPAGRRRATRRSMRGADQVVLTDEEVAVSSGTRRIRAPLSLTIGPPPWHADDGSGGGGGDDGAPFNALAPTRSPGPLGLGGARRRAQGPRRRLKRRLAKNKSHDDSRDDDDDDDDNDSLADQQELGPLEAGSPRSPHSVFSGLDSLDEPPTPAAGDLEAAQEDESS